MTNGKVAVEYYRYCETHGIIGAGWEEKNPPCPWCKKPMQELTKEQIKDLERYL